MAQTPTCNNGCSTPTKGQSTAQRKSNRTCLHQKPQGESDSRHIDPSMRSRVRGALPPCWRTRYVRWGPTRTCAPALTMISCCHTENAGLRKNSASHLRIHPICNDNPRLASDPKSSLMQYISHYTKFTCTINITVFNLSRHTIHKKKPFICVTRNSHWLSEGGGIFTESSLFISTHLPLFTVF